MNETQTAVQVPQWMIELHNARKSLFLAIVEPVIVYILGPVEEDQTEETLNMYEMPMSMSDHDHAYVYSREFDEERRRLGFLPSYVEDVSSFRETSMSFATLMMLFTTMACVFTVFLSCFYHNQQTSPLFASPRRHRLPRLVPPPLPVDGTFSWIRVCFYMSDEEVSNK